MLCYTHCTLPEFYFSPYLESLASLTLTSFNIYKKLRTENKL